MKNKWFAFFILIVVIGCTKSEETISRPGEKIETRSIEAEAESSSVLISINRELTMAYEFFLRGDYSKALRVYKKAVREYVKFDYLHRAATAYSNIATVLQSMNDLPGSERYLTLSSEIGEHYIANDIERLRLKAVNLNKLALTTFLQGNIEKAKSINESSYTINKTINNEIGISKNYRIFALIFNAKGNSKEAINFLERALELNTKYMDYYDTILNRISLAEIYAKEKKYSLALYYFNLALNVAKRRELSLQIYTVLYKTGELYEAQGMPEQALDYHKRAFEVGLNLEADDSIRKQKENESSAKVKDLYTKLKKTPEFNAYREIINFFYYTRDDN